VTQLLIVEDDAALRRALVINLTARGYQVIAVADGKSALHAGGRDPIDLVILDLGLPDMDGLEVLRGLRGWNAVPVIVLSARDSQRDKVAALDTGADDFVTKPFGMDELLARVRASLRRANVSATTVTDTALVETDSFIIDLAAKRVRRGGDEVRLTPTEWHIVEILVRNRERLVSQQQLLTQVWGPAYESETNYLRVYLAQLRRKLEDDPSHPRHFITEAGMGYRFQP
jgi:two-component system KDP operon response regulator KdpE